MITINEGSIMTKPHFKPEFRQKIAEFVVDKGYSIREAAEAMGVEKSIVDKRARDLRKELNGEGIQGTPISEERRRIRELESENQPLEMEKEILKKGYRSLDAGLNEWFTLIVKMKESYLIRSLCEAFEIHRSSYRYWTVNTHNIKSEDVS